MKTKIPIGRTIFVKLNTKVTITRCNLEPNLRFFITFVWVDFLRNLLYKIYVDIFCKKKRFSFCIFFSFFLCLIFFFC